ncbi:ATP-dependent DNA helicase [Alkaliphilus sp. B6464]|uniref:ATP-dependent DNA helicase n=1 Tax=Alkaliphilus sp. B6464 TaxID=2731219 RepID=UPI001BA83165|nr:ATP-dependent DNA helicase [Alkaliphilus sp. B6464]QUH18864.1 ATP-dependent DNA helicase [Alkaliphilus sp. B6464]
MGKHKEVVISIRSLVEFVLMSGDLDSRFTGSSRALEGTRAHQKIQKSYGEEYTPEVTLKYSFEYESYKMTVQGRADGILIEENNVVVDEIKSTTISLDLLDENKSLTHWGQAKCYGYIYAKEKNLEVIDIQLTYYNLDTDETKKFRKSFNFEELEVFFYQLIKDYYNWVDTLETWKLKRDISIKELQFPFLDYRKGQRELAVAVYRTIREEKRLFAQAPTGIGKTISTLFPTVKAIGEGITSKIFYLTAKTITRQVAEEAFSKMRDGGLRFKTVTLTAKDKICFEKGKKCTPEECGFAKGHFNRLRDGLKDLFNNEDGFTREVIEKYALKHNICPFEFSLDIALWADGVICDYNYAFDPRVYLKRFFMDEKGDYTFLIDEAHNLVDRSRTMFSAELNKKAFLDQKRIMKDKSPKISKALHHLNTFMISMNKQCGEASFYMQKEEPKEIYPLLGNFIREAEEWLKEGNKEEGYEDLLELYFNTFTFLKIAEFYDERYLTYVEKKNRDVILKIFCLDPSYLLGEAIKRGKSAIFFSATLTPLQYFKEIFGGNEEDYCVRLGSPFDSDNLCLIVADYISTKYRDRDNSYMPIVDTIANVVEGRKGNYFVFFPSYQYLRRVFDLFMEKYPHIAVIAQESTMTEEQREEFLNRFEIQFDNTLVAFGVLGGIFSEGIDLVGDRLIGAIIIGVGLPQLSLEVNLIMDYFNDKKNKGYEYAYLFPGMNKVLQGAGRVIRTEKDKGIVCLIDDRFTSHSYQRLFPPEWKHFKRANNGKNLSYHIDEFWDKKDRLEE